MYRQLLSSPGVVRSSWVDWSPEYHIWIISTMLTFPRLFISWIDCLILFFTIARWISDLSCESFKTDNNPFDIILVFGTLLFMIGRKDQHFSQLLFNANLAMVSMIDQSKALEIGQQKGRERGQSCAFKCTLIWSQSHVFITNISLCIHGHRFCILNYDGLSEGSAD
jgi:hypothetical protein